MVCIRAIKEGRGDPRWMQYLAINFSLVIDSAPLAIRAPPVFRAVFAEQLEFAAVREPARHDFAGERREVRGRYPSNGHRRAPRRAVAVENRAEGRIQVRHRAPREPPEMQSARCS